MRNPWQYYAFKPLHLCFNYTWVPGKLCEQTHRCQRASMNRMAEYNDCDFECAAGKRKWVIRPWFKFVLECFLIWFLLFGFPYLMYKLEML